MSWHISNCLCYFYLVFFRQILHSFLAIYFVFCSFITFCTLYIFLYGNSGHFVFRYKEPKVYSKYNIRNNDFDDDDVRFLTICYSSVFVISLNLLPFSAFFLSFTHNPIDWKNYQKEMSQLFIFTNEQLHAFEKRIYSLVLNLE